MKAHLVIAAIVILALFRVSATSGDFAEVTLDATPGNEALVVAFQRPLAVRSVLFANNWHVIGRNRKKEETDQPIRLVRVRGFPKNANGEIQTNLPPESAYYDGAAVLLKRPFQPGWAYKVKFHVAEGALSVGRLTGLEASTQDLTSDWVELKPEDKPPASAWQLIDSLHGPSLRADIRNAQGNGANIGIDYDFRLFSYDPLRFAIGDSAISGAGLKAGSKGYLKNESSSKLNPKLDSIISSFDAYLDMLFASDNRLATFLTPQIGFKNEANQSFKTSTYTLGAGTSFDLGFLFPVSHGKDPSFLQKLNFLDTAQTRRAIEAPRFYVGYDRVFNVDSSNRPQRTGDSSSQFNRLMYEAAWGLPVLNERSYLTVSWTAYHDLDASRNNLHSLLEVAMTYALSEPKADNKSPISLLLKYINGSLPPNFGSESSVVAGLSVTLK